MYGYPISVRARVRLEHQATVFLNVVLAPKNSPDGVATTSKIMGPFEPQGSLVEPLVVDVTLDGIDARNALKPGEYTVGDAGHDWLMTRAQWSDGKSQLYVLFVVSDGSGNGTVAFEFGDRAKFGCKTTLSVVRIMEFDPRAAVHAPQPQVNGCAFSDNVPLKAAAAYQVSFE